MNCVPVTKEGYSKREEARNCNKRGKVMSRLQQQVSDTNALYSIEISIKAADNLGPCCGELHYGTVLIDEF